MTTPIHRTSISSSLASDEEYMDVNDPRNGSIHVIDGKPINVKQTSQHLAASNDGVRYDSVSAGSESLGVHNKAPGKKFDVSGLRLQKSGSKAGRKTTAAVVVPTAIGAAAGAAAIAAMAGVKAGAVVGAIAGTAIPIPVVGNLAGAALGAVVGGVVGLAVGIGVGIVAYKRSKSTRRYLEQAQANMLNSGFKINSEDLQRLNVTEYKEWKPLLNIDTKRVPNKQARQMIRDKLVECVAQQGLKEANALKPQLEALYGESDRLTNNTSRNQVLRIAMAIQHEGHPATAQSVAHLLTNLCASAERDGKNSQSVKDVQAQMANVLNGMDADQPAGTALRDEAELYRSSGLQKLEQMNRGIVQEQPIPRNQRKLDPVTAAIDWKKAVSTRGSGLSAAQPEVVKTNNLLHEYMFFASSGNAIESKRALSDLSFHLNRWNAGTDDRFVTWPADAKNLLTAVTEELQENYADVQIPKNNIKEIIKPESRLGEFGPGGEVKMKIGWHHKADGDKYKTLGMNWSGGLSKDYNNPLSDLPKLNEDNEVTGLLYRTAKERDQFLVEVRDDGLLYQNGQPMNGDGYLFVMDGQGKIYSANKAKVVHHSSLLAGNPAAAAGMMTVKNGQLTYIRNYSGHYTPTREYTKQFVKELKSRGVDFKPIKGELGLYAKEKREQLRKTGTDPDNPNSISPRIYPNIGVVHQGF
ncbi:MAG: hypothetical protein GY701_19180 [Sulfitobacter sp.]|nr:hypothetical protein [Sulfitobacter sp.]